MTYASAVLEVLKLNSSPLTSRELFDELQEKYPGKFYHINILTALLDKLRRRCLIENGKNEMRLGLRGERHRLTWQLTDETYERLTTWQK
jgi:hypothetical protein